MSVTASPARATACSAAVTNDRPDGNRRSSDVCDRNTRRGVGSPDMAPRRCEVRHGSGRVTVSVTRPLLLPYVPHASLA
jgi:hypothetical protein